MTSQIKDTVVQCRIFKRYAEFVLLVAKFIMLGASREIML